MSDQNPKFSQEFHQESDPTASLSKFHHLHSTAVNCGTHQPSTKAAPLFASFMDQSTKGGCGHGSTMRVSSASFLSPPQQEPSSQRATLQPPSSSISTGDFCAHGFTKLPLPSTFSAATSPVLRRTNSSPINSPGPKDFTVDQAANEAAGNFLNHHLPPVISAVNSVAASPSAPLYRTVSDPTYLSYPVAVRNSNSPPRAPQVARKLMPSSPSNGLGDAALNIRTESPATKVNSQRLNEIKDWMRDMSKRCNEAINESEEEDIGSEHNENLPKVDESVPVSQETEGEAPGEEEVWVERKGDCLMLHFKCPCTKGYQILLCGNNCYYKLT